VHSILPQTTFITAQPTHYKSSLAEDKWPKEIKQIINCRGNVKASKELQGNPYEPGEDRYPLIKKIYRKSKLSKCSFI